MPIIQAAKTLPTSPGIRAVVITQMSTVGMSVSPFTAQQQAQEWSGQMWKAQVALPRMTRAQAANWIATLVSLRGMAGTFMLGDPSCKTPRGANLGTPLINGNNNGGSSVSIKGWTPNTQHVLLPYDWIQLPDNHLHMILSDENADAGGVASFDIWPDLRTPFLDGQPVITTNAQGVFRLASNEQSWDIDEAITYGLQFNCMEAI
jgi:hypothetical protein